MNFNLIFLLRANTNELLFRNFLNHYKPVCKKVYFTFVGDVRDLTFYKDLIEEYGYEIAQSVIVNSKYHMSFDGPLNNIIHLGVKDGEWVINVDVDEFLDLNNIPYDRLDDVDVIKGFLIDRLDEGLTFEKEISTECSISDDYPKEYVFKKALLTSHPYKVPFYKKHKDLIISGGHHAFTTVGAFEPRVAEKYLKLFHYKWRKEIMEYLSERILYYDSHEDHLKMDYVPQYFCELINQYDMINNNRERLNFMLNEYCRAEGGFVDYEQGIEFYC